MTTKWLTLKGKELKGPLAAPIGAGPNLYPGFD